MKKRTIESFAYKHWPAPARVGGVTFATDGRVAVWDSTIPSDPAPPALAEAVLRALRAPLANEGCTYVIRDPARLVRVLEAFPATWTSVVILRADGAVLMVANGVEPVLEGARLRGIEVDRPRVGESVHLDGRLLASALRFLHVGAVEIVTGEDQYAPALVRSAHSDARGAVVCPRRH